MVTICVVKSKKTQQTTPTMWFNVTFSYHSYEITNNLQQVNHPQKRSPNAGKKQQNFQGFPTWFHPISFTNSSSEVGKLQVQGLWFGRSRSRFCVVTAPHLGVLSVSTGGSRWSENGWSPRNPKGGFREKSLKVSGWKMHMFWECSPRKNWGRFRILLRFFRWVETTN